MNEANKLPEGWVWSSIEELATIIQYGYTESAKDKPIGPKFLRITDIQDGRVNWDSVPYCICSEDDHSKYRLQSGDIVFARTGATTGKSYLIIDCPDAVFASYLIRLRFVNQIDYRYISMFLNSPSYWSQIMAARQGSAQPGVNATILATLRVPLPSLAEQNRIVAAIEQQMSRLDAGVAALRHAQAKLKRYRAAVLKAAVEGKLTEAWRDEHPTTEPASILLERILKERRTKWEGDLRAKGKVPAKVKYVELAKPDAESLPELPEGWCWASLNQCSRRITDGTHLPPQFTEAGIPFIFVTHIVKGSISFENTKHISESTYKELNARCPVEYGDILYSAVGSYGVAVPVLTHHPFSFQRHIAHIKPSQLLSMKYLLFCLNSSWCLDQAHKLARGVAQKTVTLGDLVRFIIPIAPLNEQEQIVAEVKQHLSIITQLEAIVEANLKRAERLRQSILKEAFAGRLVPQDPNDEPASVLLERIRKEREGQKKGAVSNGRYIKVSSEPVQIDVEGTRQVELWEGV